MYTLYCLTIIRCCLVFCFLPQVKRSLISLTLPFAFGQCLKCWDISTKYRRNFGYQGGSTRYFTPKVGPPIFPRFFGDFPDISWNFLIFREVNESTWLPAIGGDLNSNFYFCHLQCQRDSNPKPFQVKRLGVEPNYH